VEFIRAGKFSRVQIEARSRVTITPPVGKRGKEALHNKNNVRTNKIMKDIVRPAVLRTPETTAFKSLTITTRGIHSVTNAPKKTESDVAGVFVTQRAQTSDDQRNLVGVDELVPIPETCTYSLLQGLEGEEIHTCFSILFAAWGTPGPLVPTAEHEQSEGGSNQSYTYRSSA